VGCPIIISSSEITSKKWKFYTASVTYITVHSFFNHFPRFQSKPTTIPARHIIGSSGIATQNNPLQRSKITGQEGGTIHSNNTIEHSYISCNRLERIISPFFYAVKAVQFAPSSQISKLCQFRVFPKSVIVEMCAIKSPFFRTCV
jgi:hypothetical protein